jgi:membrane associated rhomboid family serine protease
MDQVREFLYNARATVGLTVVTLGVYGLQLLIAGSTDLTAAFQMVDETIRPNPEFYLVLGPLLHSTHSHVAGNVVSFLICGSVVEQQIESRQLAGFVVGTAVLSNVLPQILGIGGFGLGISGALYGLWTFASIRYYRDGPSYTGQHEGVVRYLVIIGMSLVIVVGGLYALTGVAQFGGLLPVGQGVSAGAHFLGIVFGAGFWMYRRR